MAKVIPIKDNPNHSILISLEDVIYKLLFKYNTTSDFWTIDIYSVDDVLLLAGVKIVANYALLFYHKKTGLMSGDFICEIADTNARITRDSFSSGAAKLLYLTEVELAAV